MPLLIALAEIGQRDGTMLPANAAALVGAGVLSVLFFPSVAAALHKRGERGRSAGGPPGSDRPGDPAVAAQAAAGSGPGPAAAGPRPGAGTS